MVKAWRDLVTIPTYEVGKPEKNPMFLEKRVYQGSSGVVYPYPVIETISDKKEDKTYQAIWLENEYIKVMVLPELGGRVQMAYDKIKQRHFVYYNHVVKPALVGKEWQVSPFAPAAHTWKSTVCSTTEQMCRRLSSGGPILPWR